ncbi:hypothetical protein QFZ37_003388 [Chryseobacterium ginsenosidimutans]|uniref:hypothetical protein n=1 Tax=Chryseobacterium ginsenosidimutans TaxID=687846 RepID=UPI00277F3004|nr:hypothetical protein [Chryseobacterium ginsenosidimutans]MDQ0595019.1 hypothetical protein [Chryseobacterium ginsenosidimutans]
MKKLIPIFSITVASVFMQNCTHQNEDIISDHDQYNEIGKAMMMRGDSAKTSEEIVDPDPSWQCDR